MPLTIPSGHKAIINKVARLTAEERASVTNALKTLELGSLSVERLARQLAEHSDLSEDECNDLLSVIANLHALPLVGALDRKEVIPEVLEALEGDKKVGLKDLDLKVVSGFLEEALKIPALEVFSKAIHLYAGHERLFSRAKIFTDLRPVFGENLDKPDKFVISHTMRLSVYRGSQREGEDIYIALDKADLDMLAGVIDRARKKQESLAEFSASSGVETLTPEEK